MPHGLATIFQVILGSSFGAGIVTFALNFWKAERDIRRANVERLYTVFQKYSDTVRKLALIVRDGDFDYGEQRHEIYEKVFGPDRYLMDLLVDLYFPQKRKLFTKFEATCLKLLSIMEMKEKPTSAERTAETEAILKQAEELRKAVVSLVPK
jgi:hypothetical protein